MNKSRNCSLISGPPRSSCLAFKSYNFIFQYLLLHCHNLHLQFFMWILINLPMTFERCCNPTTIFSRSGFFHECKMAYIPTIGIMRCTYTNHVRLVRPCAYNHTTMFKTKFYTYFPKECVALDHKFRGPLLNFKLQNGPNFCLLLP